MLHGKCLISNSLQTFPPENKGVVIGFLKNASPAQMEDFSWPTLPFYRSPKPHPTASSESLKVDPSLLARGIKTRVLHESFLAGRLGLPLRKPPNGRPT